MIVFSMSRWTRVFLPMLAGWSAPFALFGLFWLVTHKRGWPPLRPSIHSSISRRVLWNAVSLAAVVCFAIVSVFGFSALYSSTFSPDCSGHPLFSEPLFAGQAVFTAHMLVVGRSLNSFQLKGLFSSGVKPWQVGDWAIAKVERRFWGVPWPGVVLLTNGVFWRGEPYFIDGRRPRGLLTRFFPIVEAGPCARSKPAVDADLEFRTLQGGQPSNSTRIMGYAVGPVTNSMYLERPRKRPYLSGVQVSLIGASGTTITTTDKNGIYEFDRVQPADYTIEARSGTDITHARPLRAEEIRKGSAVEVDLFFGLNR